MGRGYNMIKVEAENFYLDPDVKVTNQERLSLDVYFKVLTFLDDEEGVEVDNPDIEIQDDSAIIATLNAKVYDDKWVDYDYAADADGAHMHIFHEAVAPIERNSISHSDFRKRDGELNGKHMVWGRVAVIDNNFHALRVDKSVWNSEEIRGLFTEIEGFLVDILNTDFIVLDLKQISLDAVKTSPGLLLMTDSLKLKRLETEDQLTTLNHELEVYLLSQGFIYTGNKNYMVKKYDSLYSYKTKAKNNNRSIRRVLKSFYDISTDRS